MYEICVVKNAYSVFSYIFCIEMLFALTRSYAFLCVASATHFLISEVFTMEKLTAGLFSKVLKDSINEDLSKILINYTEYLTPAKDALINSESTVALFDIKKILSKKNISENTKLQRIQDVFDRYDLDFDSYI